MHLNDFSLGYFGSNGIVGASLGIAMGAALAAKLRRIRPGLRRLLRRGRREHRAHLGGGELRRHPAAAADRLLREQPVRGRDLHRPRDRRPLDRRAGRRVRAARRVQVDGQDVCAVYRATRRGAASGRAAAAARRSSRRSPTATTATTPARSPSTAPSEEVEHWRLDPRPDRRPPPRARGGRAARRRPATSSSLEQARRVVAEAIAFAEASPLPDPATATRRRHESSLRRERTVMSALVTVGQAFQQGLREEMIARRDACSCSAPTSSSAAGTSPRSRGSGPSSGTSASSTRRSRRRRWSPPASARR